MDLVPDMVEDENVFPHRKLNDRDLLFGEVVLEIEPDKLVVLVLHPLLVHGEDAVQGVPLVGVDDLNPRVAVGVELVHLRRPLAVVHGVMVHQAHQGGRGCTHGGREQKGGEEDTGFFDKKEAMCE